MSTELNPSKLGTKAHWDSVYKDELTNFKEIGDEGEIWFGVETIEKIVDWASDHCPLNRIESGVLDIGSGNGHLIFALVEAGYTPTRAMGIDYSPDAVKLSQSISSDRDQEAITFAVCDILESDPPMLPHMHRLDTWDLVLDKGTFDAIALGEKDESGRSPAAAYPERVARILKPGGVFLITSCNFTQDELQATFITPETGLVYHSRIQHPTFTFGGRTGSTISSIAFCKPVAPT